MRQYYEERPPKTARIARAAWDYFLAKNGKVSYIYYSPNCYFEGKRGLRNTTIYLKWVQKTMFLSQN